VITSETVLDPSVDRRLAVDLDAAEGDRLIAYQDIGGLWTCGRGHLLPPPAPGRTWAGFTVPQSTSDRWFSSDARKSALTEIAFNMGSGWVQFGPTRAAITAKEWRTVHDHLLASLWAKQVGPTRSNRIANYFLTGEYP
jgi:GH24 family phage-related lysozyme (muramidase)